MAIAQRAGGTAKGKSQSTLSTTSFNCQLNDVISVVISGIGTPTTFVGSAPTDTIGNTYTKDAEVANGTTDFIQIYTTISIGTNATNIVTATNAESGGATYTVTAESYSGAPALGNIGTNTGASTAPAVTVVTQDANNWVSMGASSTTTATYSATAPNVIRQTTGTTGGSAASNITGAEGDAGNFAAAGSHTVTFATSASVTWSAAGVELRSVAPFIWQQLTQDASPLRYYKPVLELATLRDFFVPIVAAPFTWQQYTDDIPFVRKVNIYDNPEVPKLGYLDIFVGAWQPQHFGVKLDRRGMAELPEVNKLGYLDTFSAAWQPEHYGIKLDKRGIAELPEVNKLGYLDIFSSAWNRQDTAILRRLIGPDASVLQQVVAAAVPFTWQQLTHDVVPVRVFVAREALANIRELVTAAAPFTWQQLIQEISPALKFLEKEALANLRELVVVTPPITWGWEPITLGGIKQFLKTLDKISDFYRIEPIVVPIDWEVMKAFAKFRIQVVYDPSIRDLTFAAGAPPTVDVQYLIIKLGPKLYMTISKLG